MKKRILSLILAICLLGGNCLTVFADETEPASQESSAEEMPVEIQEQPALESQNEDNAPGLTQDSLAVDVDRQYPGMDKTYSAGYSGTVAEGKLRIILPLLNRGGLSVPVNVTLSAAFLTAEERKESVAAQNIALESGEMAENIYLADFEITLTNFATPGSYPVKVAVDIGAPAQAVELPLSLNVVIPQVDTPPTEPTEPTSPTEPDTTTPTNPSTPTEPSDPISPTEPSVPKIPTVLEIDSSHIYNGMDMAYEDGYLPRVSDGTMKIVLPLKCSGGLWDDKLDTSISLDTSAASPFVVENFRKTFYLEAVTPKNGSESQEIYLVTYDIQLSDERRNGT